MPGDRADGIAHQHESQRPRSALLDSDEEFEQLLAALGRVDPPGVEEVGPLAEAEALPEHRRIGTCANVEVDADADHLVGPAVAESPGHQLDLLLDGESESRRLEEH